MARTGRVQKKILLLLLAGLSISMTRSAKQHFRIIRQASREWREIDKKALETAVDSLYKSKLITQKNNKDGTVTFVLSKNGIESGELLSLTYQKSLRGLETLFATISRN